MKILHISDIHIDERGIYPGPWNAKANLNTALKHEFDADIIIISGDLANGSIEDYEYLKKRFEYVHKPMYLIPGNHDTHSGIEYLEPYLSKLHSPNISNDALIEHAYAIAVDKSKRILFLDSSNGYISDKQLQWALEETSAHKTDEYLIFTHYPPCLCKHKFMDTQSSLKNIKTVQATLKKIKNCKHIFTGHYHHKYEIQLKSKQIVHVAPAIQMQIEDNSDTFKCKSILPGWQLIEWKDDNSVTVEVFEEQEPTYML